MRTPVPAKPISCNPDRRTHDTLDLAAIAAHGLGRGDFAALVFSGSINGLSEAPGYCTWNTARKFALPDPRLPESEDLARAPGSPLPRWPEDRVRPLDGVCFVFTDDGHPAVDAIKARSGIDMEHFVVLSRLSGDEMLRTRLAKFRQTIGERPIVLLGFGDQGVRIATLLAQGGDASRIHVMDDRPDRQVAAAGMGLAALATSSPTLADAAVISSPLTRPRAFGPIIERAILDGRPVLDNAIQGDDQPELVASGKLWLTPCARRGVRVDGQSIATADHGLDLPISIIQDHDLRIGPHEVRCLASGRRAWIGPSPGSVPTLDPAAPDPRDPLARSRARPRRVFVNIDGQSNHHDAAFAIFAAREFLSEFFGPAVHAILPSRHRAALGATPFERLVPRTATGRSLGSPYMTVCEQTALGVLARHYAGGGRAASPIVEIGSALGGSALLMAAGSAGLSLDDGPHLFSIDPDVPTRGAMRLLFTHEGATTRLTQIVKTSDEAIANLGHLADQAGLVFIDGLHTAAASAADFANYARLVRPGGCVAFHDCDLRHAGVFHTVAQIAATDRRFSLRCMVDTIAVFERSGGA
jgi:predicted O-methyltransferase YrrM